jgi:hypothetical protein
MRRAAALLLAFLAITPAAAQISGTVFEDRDGDGILDAGEPVLEAVQLELYGTPDAGGFIDQTIDSDSDGNFFFSPGNGCYLIGITDPPGWRLSQAREDGFVDGTTPYGPPVGQPRFAKLDHAIANLRAGAIRYSSIGDSIAYNFNLCSPVSDFWYSRQLRSRIACSDPLATVTLAHLRWLIHGRHEQRFRRYSGRSRVGHHLDHRQRSARRRALGHA